MSPFLQMEALRKALGLEFPPMDITARSQSIIGFSLGLHETATSIFTLIRGAFQCSIPPRSGIFSTRAIT